MQLVTEMTQSLGDKYNRILDRETYAEKIRQFDPIGIGLTFEQSLDDRDSFIVTSPPTPGSPADKAGIQRGDLITAFNGISTTKETKAFDIIDQILNNNNNNNNKITITIKIPSNTRDITMDRTIFSKAENPNTYKIDRDVGYIKIKTFNSLVKSKFKEALQNYNKRVLPRTSLIYVIIAAANIIVLSKY